jgi:hypothetical protein
MVVPEIMEGYNKAYMRYEMLWNMFQGFQIVHEVLLILAAVGFFMFWARKRFWLPKYVHVLAAIGLAVGLWCEANAPANAPINNQGPIAKLLLVLALPAMVYFFFVFHGGQFAAFDRRFGASVPCPYCKRPVAAFRDGDCARDGELSYAERQCPHCGQTLA